MRRADVVMENLDGKFWTRQDEMVAEIEALDYEVISLGWEVVVVIDLQEDDDVEYILHIGHANRTMWVESVEI